MHESSLIDTRSLARAAGLSLALAVIGCGGASYTPAPPPPLDEAPTSTDASGSSVEIVLPGVDHDFDADRTAAVATLDGQPSSAVQIVGVSHVFDRMGGLSSATGRGLVVCRFRVTGGTYDDRTFGNPFSPPDITLRMHFGDEAPMSASGPEDETLATVSVPNAPLSGPLRVVAVDRDVVGSDRIATLELELGTFEVRAESGNGALRCRAASADWAAERARTPLTAVDRELTRLEETLSPGEGSSERQPPRAAFQGLQRQVRRAVALLGWGHPMIAPRLARHAALIARWQNEIDENLRTLEPAGDAWSGVGDGIRVRLVRAECPTATRGCAISISARYPPTSNQFTRAVALVLISTSGQEIRAREVTRARNGEDLGRGLFVEPGEVLHTFGPLVTRGDTRIEAIRVVGRHGAVTLRLPE